MRLAFINTLIKEAQSNKDIQGRDERIAYEIHLWRVNDLRTHMFVTNRLLKLDLCRQQVDLPVHFVSILQSEYFNKFFSFCHLKFLK